MDCVIVAAGIMGVVVVVVVVVVAVIWAFIVDVFLGGVADTAVLLFLAVVVAAVV